MTTPLLKKEIAAKAGISMRTMQRNKRKFAWIEDCRTKCGGRRPTYNADRVKEELRKRNTI